MSVNTLSKPTFELQNSHGDLVGISDAMVQKLNALKTTNRYRAGQSIYYQGNQPFGLFYVHQGTVKLYQHSTDDKVYISKIAGSDELLGYGPFFTQQSYGETAEAMEDAVISFWDRSVIMNLLKEDPQLGLLFLSKCGKDLRDAEERATANAYKSAQERMIDLMVTLQARHGHPKEDGSVAIDLKLSREDIASMIGSTLETAVRLLSRLKESNLIQTKVRGSIVVLNPHALAAKAV